MWIQIGKELVNSDYIVSIEPEDSYFNIWFTNERYCSMGYEYYEKLLETFEKIEIKADKNYKEPKETIWQQMGLF